MPPSSSVEKPKQPEKPKGAQWGTKTKTTCSYGGDSYKTLDEAKAECSKAGSAGCGGVLDFTCGKSGVNYRLCHGSQGQRERRLGLRTAVGPDTSHCVYTPPSNSVEKPKEPEKPKHAGGWATVKNKDCDTLGKTKYNSHAEAKAACEKAGSSCGGVMDYNCVEGPKQELFLCK